MTRVYLEISIVGPSGVVGQHYELRKFTYRYQARSWLVVNGYWQQEGNTYTNPYTGNIATLESRKRA